MDLDFLYPDAPDEDAAAIDTLEACRRQGGEYLLFSRYGRWWLDHYTGFSEYLDAHYRRVEEAPEYVLFDVR